MAYRIETIERNDFVIRDLRTGHEVAQLIRRRSLYARPGKLITAMSHEAPIIAEIESLRGDNSNPLEQAVALVERYESSHPWEWERKTRHGVLRARRSEKGWVVARDGFHLLDFTGWAAVFPTLGEAQKAGLARAGQGRPGWKPTYGTLIWSEPMKRLAS
jgi:hypothetical protein